MALSKAELKKKWGEQSKTEECGDVVVRGLTGTAYQEFHARRALAVSDPPKVNGEVIEGVALEQYFRTVTDAAWLFLGVVEPKMTFDEWMHVLETTGNNVVRPVISRIEELSGEIPFEKRLASAAASTSGDTQKSSSG